MDASDRRLAVSWEPVEGATGYKVAARLMNGVEPFAWAERQAESSPYVIEERWAAMSGLKYEVRAASINADGQSEWSDSVSATAPALRPAPPDAIRIILPGPYRVGDLMEVSVGSQQPFANRSTFIWSVCEIDGSWCELLPPVESLSYVALASPAIAGKRAVVQVDYDKEGLSYTATAVVGVVNPPPPDGAIETLLHSLELDSVHIKWDAARGGAIEPLGNDLLAATPWGKIALARSDGSVEQVEGRVPMHLEGLRAVSPSSKFRVADILLRQRSEKIWDLFVTHHYFTGECVLFRLSSTTILMAGGTPSVSPSWKTVFDAEPCLGTHNGERAGGSMLTDGPDHLLIVVGDHGKGELAQDPNSHLGKLVRVDSESGAAEILALGFRNPQGLARDADGNLWETEHGPRGGDELNLLEPGGNYGWPYASYGLGAIGGDTGEHAGFAKPAFAWNPAIGVSSVIVNDAGAFPLWKDDLLAASLTGACLAAECAGHALFRIRRDGTRVRYVERIELGHRIRDLAKMPDGRIAALAEGGIVYFIRLFDAPLRE